jgi:hypothetical protein
MVISDSTISANSATGGAAGSGSPPGIAGVATGGIRRQAGSASLSNSIVGANTSSGSAPDLSGAFTSNGFNLIGNSTGATGFPGPSDQIGVSPQLGPLQNNGGPTDTMALLSGSPAIDKGRSNGLTVDQRGVGYVRTVDDPSIAPASGGDNTDIGAFEFGALINAVSRKIHNTAPTPTAFDISLPLVGPIGIECRKNTGLDSTGPNVGHDHEIIVTFPVNVTVASADATDAPNPPATVGTTTFSVSANVVTVDLHNLPRDAAHGNRELPVRLNINLRSVSDGTTTNDVSIPMGVLFGDVNGSQRTDSGDITIVRNHTISIPTDNAAARFDVTLSGRIDSGDVTAVRNYAVAVLP